MGMPPHDLAINRAARSAQVGQEGHGNFWLWIITPLAAVPSAAA